MERLTKTCSDGSLGVAGMTEKEAIEFLKKYLNTDCYTDKCVSAHNIAVNALEEIQKYRTIGTVEECRAAVEKWKENEWISCADKLPDDGDCRFYMCLVENHAEDVPMFCQYEEELGFGFYQDIYDRDILGFVDTEFNTNEELGYENVLYWRQIPEPPKDWGDEE